MPDFLAVGLGVVLVHVCAVAVDAVLAADPAAAPRGRRGAGHPDRRPAAVGDRRAAGRRRGPGLHRRARAEPCSSRSTGMPTPLYAATPARLATYSDCPRRYRLGYLDRPTPPQGGALGAHLGGRGGPHRPRALVGPAARPADARPPAAGCSSSALAHRRLPRRAAVAGRAGTCQELGRALPRRLDPDDVPVAVERIDLGAHRARLPVGTARPARRPGRGGASSSWTTRPGARCSPSRTPASSLALAVYAAAATRTLRRACTRVELHHLPSGEVLAWEHTEESLEDHLRRADEVAAVLADLDERFRSGHGGREADEAFPARVAPRCGWCEFRAVCEPGRAVPPRRPWDGLAEPDEPERQASRHSALARPAAERDDPEHGVGVPARPAAPERRLLPAQSLQPGLERRGVQRGGGCQQLVAPAGHRDAPPVRPGRAAPRRRAGRRRATSTGEPSPGSTSIRSWNSVRVKPGSSAITCTPRPPVRQVGPLAE